MREYSRAEDKEHSFDGETDYFIPDAESPGKKRRHSSIWRLLKFSIWAGQVLLFVANIYGLTVIMKIVHRDSVSSKLKTCVVPRSDSDHYILLDPMQAPIRYVAWTMLEEKDTKPYEAVNGSSNSGIDDHWNKMLDSKNPLPLSSASTNNAPYSWGSQNG